MAGVYQDANGVEWRICPDETDPSCSDVIEGRVVSFQRLGRQDTVVCRPSVTYPETTQERRMAFEEAMVRQWTDPESSKAYRVALGGSGLTIISVSGSVAIVPDPGKVIGLLRDAELRAYMEQEFDSSVG